MRSYHNLRLAALIWGALTVTANAEGYVVRWIAVEHDMTPIPQTVSQGYVARFSFDGGHFITDEGGQTAETIAGQSALFVTKLGTRHSLSYTLRGRSIIRTDSFPGFSLVMLIKPNGRGGCHVDVDYRKLAGRTVFESKRSDGSGPSNARRVTATDARCETTPLQS